MADITAEVNAERAGYQNIGLVVGPSVFLIMLFFSEQQQTMSVERLGELLLLDYGWLLGGQQRPYLSRQQLFCR